MSDQPKKQELPPLDESIVKSVEELGRHMRAQLGPIMAVRYMVANNVLCGLEHRESQLLAALSDNEAKAARIAELEKESAKWKSHSEAAWERADGTFMDTLGLVTRNQAAEAKLKSVEGLLEEKLAVHGGWRLACEMYAQADVDALLARIREAIK